MGGRKTEAGAAVKNSACGRREQPMLRIEKRVMTGLRKR